MAVVVDAADKLVAAGAQSSITISAFALSGSDRSLVCDFAIRRNTSIAISSVSRGSDTFTSQIEAADATPRTKCGLWGSSGANEPATASTSMTGTLASSEDQWCFGYRALTGTDQTASRFDGHTSTSSTGSTASSLSVATGADDMAVDCICVRETAGAGQNLAVGANQIQDWLVSTGTSGAFFTGAASHEDATTAATMSWAWAVSKRSSHVAMNVKAAASGGTFNEAVSLGATAGLAQQPQLVMSPGVSLPSSAAMSDQNQAAMDSLATLGASALQSQSGAIDLTVLSALAANLQQNVGGGMASDGAVAFSAQAGQQQAAQLLFNLANTFSVQTGLTPDTLLQALGSVALQSGAGFAPLGSLIVSTAGTLAVAVDDAWQRGMLAEGVVALALQAGIVVDGDIPANVVTSMIGLAAKTGQVVHGSLVVGGVLAEQITAQLTPSTQLVMDRLLSMGCSASQIQSGGILHEAIMILGGAMADTVSAQQAIAGALTLAIRHSITVQSQHLATMLLSLGCTVEQVQLGTRIIEQLLTMAMRGVLLSTVTVSLANVGNVATITAEALAQPTVSSERLDSPTVTDETLI